MADYFTHYYLGKELIKKMKKTTIDEDLFLLGSQGPDIYYYLKFAVETNPPNLGQLIHKSKTRDVFKKNFIFLKDNNNLYLKSYIYGWISHYILDKNIHPYIDSKTDYNHKRLEANIDTYIIDKHLKKSVFSMKSRSILKVNDHHKSIFLLYEKIAKEVFNVLFVSKDYYKSISNFRIFHKVVNQKNIFLRKIIALAAKIFNYDLENYFYLGINEVKLPDDIGKVDNIIINSINESEIIINKLNEYLISEITLSELMNEFNDINYSGISINT